MYKIEAMFGLSASNIPDRVFVYLWADFEQNHIDRGTIIDSLGFWKGESEKSKTLSLFSDNLEKDLAYIKDLAQIWNKIASQECVVIGYSEANFYFECERK